MGCLYLFYKKLTSDKYLVILIIFFMEDVMQLSSHTQPTISNPAVMDLSFEVVNSNSQQAMAYTKECSGSRSDCCTRTCTRIVDENSSFEA